MKDKSPAFQWYPKQYLADDKVLAMDWDARGMHVHLLNIAWQQQPPGSIPDDIRIVRQWLGLPSGFADADRVWGRVWPQIKTAWALKDGRWFNFGLVRSWDRQQIYKQNGSKSNSKSRANPEQHYEDEDVVSSSSQKEPEVDGEDEFEKFCVSYGAKADRSTVCANLHMLAVEQVEKERGLSASAACIWLRQQAYSYWKVQGKYAVKMRDWLEGKMWKNHEPELVTSNPADLMRKQLED